MERQTNSDKLERLATEEEKEYLQRILGNYGLYDANDGTLGATEHPEDRHWAVELEDQSNIERSGN